MAAVGYVTGRALFRPSRRVVQPIAFNHQKHVEEVGMECNDCHELVETGRHAGLPTLTTCMDCHEEPVSDHPEEQKVRDLAQAGQDDVFLKLFRLADHAFYTHRRHVAVAGIECETCHGGIAETTVPPERPLVRITMDHCVDCHQNEGVSSDCSRCHR